jgi:hypothetical protein
MNRQLGVAVTGVKVFVSLPLPFKNISEIGFG